MDTTPSTRDEIEALKRAFLQLPPRVRLIFHLVREDGLDYEQVAARLGIAPELVETLLWRGMEYLLEPEGDSR